MTKLKIRDTKFSDAVVAKALRVLANSNPDLHLRVDPIWWGVRTLVYVWPDTRAHVIEEAGLLSA